MELLLAAKGGDVNRVTTILNASSSGIDFENENYLTLDRLRQKKSIYCAECYQRIKRRDRKVFGSDLAGIFGCDWHEHMRSVVVTDTVVDICTCTDGGECNWLVCLDCFIRVTYELKASHQMYGLQEGFSPLIAASSSGRLDCVTVLLDHGANVNLADPNGLTALLAAASACHTGVVKVLLEHGADINSAEKAGLTALFMACEVGDVATVEVLLGFHPDLTIRDKGGATLLHAAACSGHVGIMEALIDRGLSPTATDSAGDTPLHWIPGNGSAAAVRLLLDKGAHIDAANESGYTPILMATLRHNAVAVSTLLKAGAKATIVVPSWGAPLGASCLGNFHRVTEVLLAGGVDSTIGTNPLRICAERNYPMCAEICLKYGVRGAGDALYIAARGGFPAMVKVILQHWTGEGDMSNNKLNRALGEAVKLDVLSSVKMLLEHGADATARLTTAGATALDLAKSSKVKNMIKAHLAGDDLDIGEDDEETKSNNRGHLLSALKKGTKKWGRSKIMIVGDGRAGKTALANSIMGEEFAHTESTIGINQMTCDVKFAEVGKEGQWDEYTKPDKELEAALAKIVAARRGNEEVDEQENNVVDALPIEQEVNVKPASEHKAANQNIGSTGPAVTAAAGTAVSISSYKEESGVPSNQSGMVIDDALVMKYLANLTDTTKFVISLFDYGGQTVFNVIHHLFLTRYGVYTLVFNMEQLVSQDPAVRENCLATISFWLNSVVVHTWNADTSTMAPVVIVGTHKDIVNSPSQHAEISKILHDKFCRSVAWPWIQENEETDADGADASLCFFPVDNRKSRKDTMVVKMMKLIEDIIDKSDYVHVERPLTWLQTMDKLTACGKAYLSLSEVEAIAQECEVPRKAVPSLLGFLHEMGILMWHDEASLRDIVILDAVAYFVTPVTTIICKHLATAMDSTRHVVEAHKKCSKLYYDAWMKMVHHGIVNTDILGTLLQESGQQASVVLHLMVKFGLVVPLQIAKQVYGNQAVSHKSVKANEYLVPALLPQLKEGTEVEQEAVEHGGEFTNTCYIVFTCSSALAESSMLTTAEAANLGFLPRGLFERLICKAVEWCRDTSAVQNLQSQPLFQDAAVLAFGNQRFRMRAFHDKNCIEVDFGKGNPLAVHQRLCDQLQQILNECMKSLRFFTVLPFPARTAEGSASGAEDMAHQQLIQLEYLRTIAKKHTGLHSLNGNKLLNKAQLAEQYGDWLVDDALRSEYDVFISYRWGAHDSQFTERVRDRFSTYNIGEDNRAVSVFLDNKRLRDGRNFVDDFARALCNSLIVVPVLSSDALKRMRDHDPHQKDHVLMEWFMALECFHSPDSRVARVLPVLFGLRDPNSDAIGDLYREGALDVLPDTHPAESIRCSIQLLHANGVVPRHDPSFYTVRGILSELKAILGYCAWTAQDPSYVVAEAAERVVVSLQEVLEEGPKGVNSAAHQSPPRMKAGPTDESGDLLSRGPGAGDEASAKQGTANPVGPSPTKHTLKSMGDEIRDQLGLSADLKIPQILEQALSTLDDVALSEACKSLSLLAKAEKIYSVVVG